MANRFDFSKKQSGWDSSEGTPDYATKGQYDSYNKNNDTPYTPSPESSEYQRGSGKAPEQVPVKKWKDDRPLFERMFYPPPPRDLDEKQVDYLADERPMHSCCGVICPQFPPKFYDEDHVPVLDHQTDVKHLIRPNQDSMWAENGLKMSEKVPFPPLIARPTIPVIIAVLAVVAVVVVMEVTPLYGILNGIGGDEKASHKELALLWSIPVISVIFTYFHIWFALWLTFYPIAFVGILRFPGTNVGSPGWQGIIPFKAERMARISVRLIAGKLIDPKTMFSRINPKIVAEEMAPMLRQTMTQVLDAVARQNSPEVWSLLPQRVKDELSEKATEDAPEIVESMFAEMRENIDDVFDLEAMIVKVLTTDKQQLVNMFVTCGYQELCFIRNTGAVMGFTFGVIQMMIWIWYRGIWYNPIYGGTVGATTNWLALQMIFRPVEPKYILGKRIQGLFLTRQKEVAALFAQIVASNILTARNMIDSMVAGPTADRMFELVHRHIRVAVDNFSGGERAQPFVQSVMGADAIDRIRRDFGNQMVAVLPRMMSQTMPYMEEALDLENTLREKVAALSSTDFEGLLHPVFQQDEWKLVALGGALGIFIGGIQVFILQA